MGELQSLCSEDPEREILVQLGVPGLLQLSDWGPDTETVRQAHREEDFTLLLHQSDK
jgi:hypothetical protein